MGGLDAKDIDVAPLLPTHTRRTDGPVEVGDVMLLRGPGSHRPGGAQPRLAGLVRMRGILGLALAATALAGVSAVGAVSAGAASSPNISRDDRTAAGEQIVSRPYVRHACALPDGTTPAIT
ncbi:hypothetical protein GCM10010300_79620 [Streptomyces olivaceoviridis]|uniref:hypothetical protein n=1 Tax=Streptomyces olivaceoviridis TaxID=1921 RepID=UPI00199B75B6|nr:hypothetical protein [Streptomyces olivaceoviridis]GGZ24216.1 hypothetical protein GCM10010300_79620 [Streptomyces olivaceoviridis]